MTAAHDFLAAIAATGLTPPGDLIADGTLHRFSTNGRAKDDAGWYVFHDDDRPAGRFGCNRSGVDSTWRADIKREFTAEEKAAWKRRMDEQRAARDAEAARQRAGAASQAAALWSRATPANGHAYLERKGIAGAAAAASSRELDGILLVPVKHGPRELVGLQRIDADGGKKFLHGTPAGGGYTTIGKPGTGPVVIVEGYATGLTVHQATGFCVVIAFNAGNLEAVARKIRAAMPDTALIIGADDDAFTDGNPGITAATLAARAVGARVVKPTWVDAERGRGTDFNDLKEAEGLQAVADCFGEPEEPEPEETIDQATGEILTLAPAVVHQTELLPAVTDEWAPQCSDDDLTVRHLVRMQNRTLWCETWGRWLIWNGDRWLRDETLAVQDQVRQTLRSIANDVQTNPDIKPDKRARQADKIASYKTLQNVERLARSSRQVATHPDAWDADMWALNTPAGVVDLRTGQIRPHAIADRFTKITAVSPAGGCPTWLTFLERATGGDKALQSFLKRMCGYSLTGEVREHALFFVYGTGGNGKGTFLNTITHIMGDYQRVAGAETFTESPGDRHTTELARLQGARLVTAQETEEGKRWAESRIKSLTGGDPITARFMRQDDFTYIPQFKLVIVGNHKPSFRNVDEAIRRRLHLIPFTVTIPASQRDPLLAEKLRAESGGILAWMIEGCTEWALNGLTAPAVVKESTDQYLGDEDVLQQWIDDCCDVDGTGFSSSRALFASWARWCEESGEFVGTMKRLMAKLESRGVSTGQKFRGERGCLGMTVKRTGNGETNPY